MNEDLTTDPSAVPVTSPKGLSYDFSRLFCEEEPLTAAFHAAVSGGGRIGRGLVMNRKEHGPC